MNKATRIRNAIKMYKFDTYKMKDFSLLHKLGTNDVIHKNKLPSLEIQPH